MATLKNLAFEPAQSENKNTKADPKKVLTHSQLKVMLAVSRCHKADAHEISREIAERYCEKEDYGTTYNILVRMHSFGLLARDTIVSADTAGANRKTFVWSVTQSGHQIIAVTGRLFRKLVCDAPIGEADDG